jgi:hypothetical protein
MGRRLERHFPLLLALIAPAVYFGLWKLHIYIPTCLGIAKLTDGVLDFAGNLVGFLATAQALLYALPDRRAIKFLREAGALGDLVTYLFTDIIVWLLTAVGALGLQFVSAGVQDNTQRITAGIWLLFPVWGVLGLVRSMYIFAKFLKLSSGDTADPLER